SRVGSAKATRRSLLQPAPDADRAGVGSLPGLTHRVAAPSSRCAIRATASIGSTTMDHRHPIHLLRGLSLAALLLAAPAFAGPPLLCDPFDTAGAPSLPWGGDRWNQPLAGYDRTHLVGQAQALLTPDTPVV